MRALAMAIDGVYSGRKSRGVDRRAAGGGEGGLTCDTMNSFTR